MSRLGGYRCALVACTAVGLAVAGPTRAADSPPLSALTVVGPATTIFSAERDGADVPDASARAFRDASGFLALFGMHYRNLALRGPDLGHLKINCLIVLDTGEKPDPELYDDCSWITAT